MNLFGLGKIRIRYIFLFVSVTLTMVSFLLGGYVQKKCLYPFCMEEGSEPALSVEPDEHGVYSEWKSLRTGLLEVRVDRVDLPAEGPYKNTPLDWAYGDLAPLSDGMLTATSAGVLYFVDENLHVHSVDGRIPFSRETFDRDTASRHISRAWFGVKDLMVQESPTAPTRLFASYHHWNSDRRCFTLRVDMTTLVGEGHAYAVREPWTTIYDTRPCLPLKDRGHSFAGHQSAGRIVSYSDTEILLSLGDNEFEGVNGELLVTDSTTSYGKILAINPATRVSRIVSMGHRNPQGLHVDANGTVWSTEHGPQGGDELNRIVSGAHYGWPHVTYGTNYGTFEWPLSKTNGEHVGYRRPVFSWFPSIGVSEMTSVQKPLFSPWKGDLLITSLKTRSLYRTRIREGRVVYTEPIEMPDRIRGIAELRDGSIAIKCAGGYIARLRPATIAGALAVAPAN